MRHPVRFSMLRLTDSAPAIVADGECLFAAQGVEVTVWVEPSRATITDKLCSGRTARPAVPFTRWRPRGEASAGASYLVTGSGRRSMQSRRRVAGHGRARCSSRIVHSTRVAPRHRRRNEDCPDQG